MTMCQYSNVKLAVFDLDETLHSEEVLYSDVISILNNLKAAGIKLYIASFHLAADDLCKKLGLNDYFQGILYGRIYSKLEMIKKIMQNENITDESQVMFFDDNHNNVYDVQMKSDICTVLVAGGLSWNHIYTAVNFVNSKWYYNRIVNFIKSSEKMEEMDIPELQLPAAAI